MTDSKNEKFFCRGLLHVGGTRTAYVMAEAK